MRRYLILVALIAIAAVVLWLMLRRPPLEVETAPVVRREVREVIQEDAETRLPRTYTVDMPLSGTVSRIALDPGDHVEKGQVLATIDVYDTEQEAQNLKSQIAQANARIQGVETTKPKPEDIRAAKVRAEQAADSVKIAQQNLETAKTNLADARRELKRQQNLFEKNIVSKRAVENAEVRVQNLEQELQRMRAAVEGAQKEQRAAQLEAVSIEESVNDNEYLRDVYQAQIEGLEASLSALRNNINKAEIRAPLTGTVLERRVEGGVFLPAGSPLLTLGDLNNVELQIDVLSEEAPRASIGDPVEISGRALRGKTVVGRVSQIYPSGFSVISALGVEQQRVRVIAQFDNSKLQLRPGTDVDAGIITAVSKNTLAVPERAVFRRENQNYVFAVKEGRAILTPVEVGLRSEEWAEIIEGLNEGDIVITEHSVELENGAKVQPAE